MDEVPEPEPVPGQVHRAVTSRPEAGPGGDPVVDRAIVAYIAVGEGGEEAGEAAEGDERPAEVPVDRVAVAGVSQDWVQELEHEDGPSREELDEVAEPGECLVLDAASWARVL